jgi:hypothetical protein
MPEAILDYFGAPEELCLELQQASTIRGWLSFPCKNISQIIAFHAFALESASEKHSEGDYSFMSYGKPRRCFLI